MNQETRCIIISTLVGTIVGWAVGIAQVIYIGSWPLIYWEFMPLMPIYSALGGALFGMILGGGGLFTKKSADSEASPEIRSRTHAA